jgi:hypothetical protein
MGIPPHSQGSYRPLQLSGNRWSEVDWTRGEDSNGGFNLWGQLEGGSYKFVVYDSGYVGPQQLAIHTFRAALFQDIIRETGQISVALQAYSTQLVQMSYYDILPFFQVSNATEVVLRVPFLKPVRYTGLTIVGCIIALHFVLVLLVLALFTSRAKYTMLGNGWQAASQISSEETSDIIASATSASDSEVKKMLKVNGQARSRFVISSMENSGRIELRKLD